MNKVLIAAALLSGSGLPVLANTSSDMECSHYIAMNAAGQIATVNSMRSKMPAANKMPSSHEIAMKVAASCKEHPDMTASTPCKAADIFCGWDISPITALAMEFGSKAGRRNITRRR
jgi:hypothetical protein